MIQFLRRKEKPERLARCRNALSQNIERLASLRAQNAWRQPVVEAHSAARRQLRNRLNRRLKRALREIWHHSQPSEERPLRSIESCLRQSRRERFVLEIQRNKRQRLRNRAARQRLCHLRQQGPLPLLCRRKIHLKHAQFL